MSLFSPSGSGSGTEGPAPRAARIPQNLRLSACERLVTGPHRQQAARNLIGSAPAHGIDLDLLWGVIQQEQAGPPRVRQACMAVLGAGATAMLFHSSPGNERWLGSKGTQCAEISASLHVCLDDLRGMTNRVRLAQCLIEPRNTWASDVFTDAGGTSPAFATLFGLNMMLTAPQGGVHSDQDVMAWMARQGFDQVESRPFPPPMPHRVVTGRKR